MEDFAYILDYLETGSPGYKGYKKEPIAYSIGEGEFKILELIPKPGVLLQIGERVYIGKEMDKREKIAHVKRRIGYNMLTKNAQMELFYALLTIVKSQEKRFVDFYNNASPISTRFHSLELLPGLGKKSLQSIVEERKKKSFESFEDIAQRSMIKQPEKYIAKRIELELSDNTQKYYLFVKPPKKKKERKRE